jgi:DNA-binding sugar fermentation-stimulating protein
MSNMLITINNVENAIILNRPSKISKTPYVADIIINQENNSNKDDEIYQAHSPSLGCCGLCEKECQVLVYPLENKTKKAVCSYRIFMTEIYEEEKEYIGYIGIEPKIAENIVEQTLKNNLFTNLNNIKYYKREVKILNSRFDYVGIDKNDNTFILEVKNVPLADYADVTKKERIKMNFDLKNFDDKIAYFPDGYRKNKGDLVSERAFKHINELSLIKTATKNTNLANTRCILCFVIQRDDISSFQASNLDTIYQKAFKEAYENGVEIFTLVTQWNYNNKLKQAQCKFVTDNLKINNFI